MAKTWLSFCCNGFNFVVMGREDGHGYGVCLNPDCPHRGEAQRFQLEEDDEEFELDDEFVDWFI